MTNNSHHTPIEKTTTAGTVNNSPVIPQTQMKNSDYKTSLKSFDTVITPSLITLEKNTNFANNWASQLTENLNIQYEGTIDWPDLPDDGYCYSSILTGYTEDGVDVLQNDHKSKIRPMRGYSMNLSIITHLIETKI
ncbi:hypothetical protein CANARDRAFT_178323 [[Candida] arabinofermentans NRRL YB-2248]|uniref:Uncharacterized protein n=1 Tax=[Candida] arabinofermentans NRRL YB-2248 TaxID=983967 RepID=A0A1E4ST66_9ASCO|nr:hypothetical protein CANARDRAFT_178323 [[Candida] arabinofermentans NRRL YB-2248]